MRTMKHKTALHLAISMIALALLLTSCSNNPASTEPPPTSVPVVIPTEPPPTPEPIVIPTARGYHSMAYDTESKQVIMFGGQTGDPTQKDGWSNETWSFDSQTLLWKKMSPPIAPGGFIGDMTYNAKADRVILVLNTDPVTPNFFDYKISQTWAYDFNSDTWTQMKDGPSGRLGARIAYDTESDKVILFGGFTLTSYQYVNETWSYDFDTDTWTQMQPSTTPIDQNYQCMAYDAKADRVVSWGGESAPSLWTYDYNTDTWEKIKAIGPRARYYCGFIYDDKADLFILYGGGELGSVETWTLDMNANTWTQVQPDQNPGKLSRHNMIFSPDINKVILFGGQLKGAQFLYGATTWIYDLNTNTWTDVTPVK